MIVLLFLTDTAFRLSLQEEMVWSSWKALQILHNRLALAIFIHKILIPLSKRPFATGVEPTFTIGRRSLW